MSVHDIDLNRRTELSITKLERALEDVLEKLSMPALELYVSPAIRELQHPPRPTQPNSPEPVNQDRDVSPDPMNSLIEATQLGGLRSQLRSVKQRRKGGMRRMDHDLIAEQLITLEEAEELLNVYVKQLLHAYETDRIQLQTMAKPASIFCGSASICNSGLDQSFFNSIVYSCHACGGIDHAWERDFPRHVPFSVLRSGCCGHV